MLNETLVKIFDRDLKNLKNEIGLYTNEADLWKTNGEITNSAGNLTLHLIGNLKHFIGAELGGSGFLRDRDTEFSAGNVLRDEMLREIDNALSVVTSTLEKLTAEDFDKIYPKEVFGQPITTELFLVHLATHLNYHLGQINYHRRILAL